MIPVTRAQVLAYRFAAHGLAPGGGAAPGTVLATGLQDYPPGRSAALALRLRTGAPPGPDTVLVHGARGALHLHRAADLPHLAAALRVADGRDLLKQSIGEFAAELADDGLSFGAALDAVAAAMRAETAEQPAPTKGELSAAVSPRVDPRTTPWCQGCGAAHVQDQLFRMATLQAGLVAVLDPDSPGRFRYRAADVAPRPATASARAGLVRAFLAAFGPAKPAHLASWLGLAPAAGRRWWDAAADGLEPVAVEGARHWMPADLLPALQDSPAPAGVRLLPPYDPLTELADRPLVVPDPARRRAVWRPAANPGAVLVDGEVAGVWRQRRERGGLVVQVETFAPLPVPRREEAAADAAVIAEESGAADARLVVD
ncbi:winged helix DNA-binding domain-containing protein [Streptomonospora sp. S1-112]|uniref:Winged helix DNA-binding domain-containing protein n=1 Tax=Streptomonospora mangrovi TaxID=2883123 RepID=A0A9X3NN06_9ACTN|nr:crosslink repair DNA glycosylase YcaQ family protein [Streptomonospora mangrovi]MDA0564774.1 winged helix DNA-binding domain-containing protein [Streptomonospora mangrovi]